MTKSTPLALFQDTGATASAWSRKSCWDHLGSESTEGFCPDTFSVLLSHSFSLTNKWNKSEFKKRPTKLFTKYSLNFSHVVMILRFRKIYLWTATMDLSPKVLKLKVGRHQGTHWEDTNVRCKWIRKAGWTCWRQMKAYRVQCSILLTLAVKRTGKLHSMLVCKINTNSYQLLGQVGGAEVGFIISKHLLSARDRSSKY